MTARAGPWEYTSDYDGNLSIDLFTILNKLGYTECK